MARELEHWLPTLAPAADGERRLREALAARGRADGPAWQPALAAVCCVLLLALALTSPRSPRPDIARALDLPPPPAVRVDDGAALEVPVATTGVRVVLVMSLEPVPDAR